MRARRDGDAWAYGDVDLDEARERYEVTLLDTATPVLSVLVEAPSYTLTASVLSAVFPAGLDTARLQVAQVSDSFGPGQAADAALLPAD